MQTNFLKNNYIYRLYFKKVLFKKEKRHLLIFLEQGIKHGASTDSLLSSILPEYERIGLVEMYNIVMRTLFLMEDEGLNVGEAFHKSGLFTESEKMTYNAISKNSISSAFEQILQQNKYKNEFKYAILMLIVPVLFVLFGYIVFLPEIKDFTLSLLEPVNAVSKTPIPIPSYFSDRTIFVVSFFSIIFFSGMFLYLVEYLKKNNPKLLFSFIKLIEREFVVNHFSVILQLMNSGLNLSDSVSVVMEDSDDALVKKILGEALEEMKEGHDLSYTVEKYFSDYATIAFLKSGEFNNQIEGSLGMILSHNKLLYEKLIARLVVWLPLAGEMVMTLVLLIPLLGILQVTTVGAMNFTV